MARMMLPPFWEAPMYATSQGLKDMCRVTWLALLIVLKLDSILDIVQAFNSGGFKTYIKQTRA